MGQNGSARITFFVRLIGRSDYTIAKVTVIIGASKFICSVFQVGGGQNGTAPPPPGRSALSLGVRGEEQGYFLGGNN